MMMKMTPLLLLLWMMPAIVIGAATQEESSDKSHKLAIMNGVSLSPSEETTMDDSANDDLSFPEEYDDDDDRYESTSSVRRGLRPFSFPVSLRDKVVPTASPTTESEFTEPPQPSRRKGFPIPLSSIDFFVAAFFIIASGWLILAILYSIILFCMIRFRAGGDPTITYWDVSHRLIRQFLIGRTGAQNVGLDGDEESDDPAHNMTTEERRAAIQEIFLRRSKESTCNHNNNVVTGLSQVKEQPMEQPLDHHDIETGEGTTEQYAAKEEDDDDESVERPTCSICLMEYEPGDKCLTSSTCPHKFHQHCLFDWLERKDKTDCPVCRCPMVSEEEVCEEVRQMRAKQKQEEEEQNPPITNQSSCCCCPFPRRQPQAPQQQQRNGGNNPSSDDYVQGVEVQLSEYHAATRSTDREGGEMFATTGIVDDSPPESAAPPITATIVNVAQPEEDDAADDVLQEQENNANNEAAITERDDQQPNIEAHSHVVDPQRQAMDVADLQSDATPSVDNANDEITTVDNDGQGDQDIHVPPSESVEPMQEPIANVQPSNADAVDNSNDPSPPEQEENVSDNTVITHIDDQQEHSSASP